MTDLKACYDRQLANIGSIVQESVGVERKLMQLIAKVIPVFEYYVYVRFGVSKQFYGG